MMRETFGTTNDGQTVERVSIANGGLTANILTWGTILQDLRLEGHRDPLVLGFNELASYFDHPHYFGATVGRFANRIANGAFQIDGVSYQLDRNENGQQTLHGGSLGVSNRNWNIEELSPSSVQLSLASDHGEMGFPGNTRHICTYSILDDATLRVELTTTTDAPTIASLAHHSYFTLDDANDCRNTILTLEADYYLPVNEHLIPTGEIAPVEGTAFDFRVPKPIGQDVRTDLNYDHNFCLSTERTPLRRVAHANCPSTGLSLEVSSTEPGLQLYCAHGLSVPANGLNGRPYGPFAGFAMEAQCWPDAPNQSQFPNAVLRPNETLTQITEYRFEKT